MASPRRNTMRGAWSTGQTMWNRDNNEPELGGPTRLEELPMEEEAREAHEQEQPAKKAATFEDTDDNIAALEKLAVQKGDINADENGQKTITNIADYIHIRVSKSVLGNVFAQTLMYASLFALMSLIFWAVKRGGMLTKTTLTRMQVKGSHWQEVADDIQKFLALLFAFYVFGLVTEVITVRRQFRAILDACRTTIQYLYGLGGTEAELALNRKIRMKMCKLYVAAYRCFMEEMDIDEDTDFEALERVLASLLTPEEIDKIREATGGEFVDAHQIIICWCGKLIRMGVPDMNDGERYDLQCNVLAIGEMFNDTKRRVIMLFPPMYTIMIYVLVMLILILECFSTALEVQIAIMAEVQGSEIAGLCVRFLMLVFFYVVSMEICNQLRYPFGTDELDIDNDWFTAAMAHSLNTHFKIDVDHDTEGGSPPGAAAVPQESDEEVPSKTLRKDSTGFYVEAESVNPTEPEAEIAAQDGEEKPQAAEEVIAIATEEEVPLDELFGDQTSVPLASHTQFDVYEDDSSGYNS